MPGVGWGYLRATDFENLIEHSPNINRVELSNWGEIFLNPELLVIMKYAHSKGVRLTGDNGANFNKCDDEVLEGLVKYEFYSLRIALDGACTETYERYRLGGDFNLVISNINRLNSYKKAYASALPKLTWQFVVFGHNEHELPLAKAMARNLGMEFDARLSWNDSWSPVRDREFVRKEVEVRAASREEHDSTSKEIYMKPCHDLWHQPTINWDGRLLGCCVNFSLGDFGNVFVSGLGELMQSERYQYAQGMVTGERSEREDIPCTRCRIYRQMKAEGRWVERELAAGQRVPEPAAENRSELTSDFTAT